MRKQLARTLSKFSKQHSELEASRFVIPQIPGTIPRSKCVKGVFEVMLTAKKYMWPIFSFHPYERGHGCGVRGTPAFQPRQKSPILDAKHEMSAPMTSADRRANQDKLEELERDRATTVDIEADARQWTSLHAAAERPSTSRRTDIAHQ